MCAEGDGGRCRINGVTYELTCKSCSDVYVGETSRNAYTRGLAHIASVSAPHNPQTTHRDGKPVPKSTLKHHVDTVHATDSTPPATSGLVMKYVCLPVYLPAYLPACWSVCLSCRDVNIGGGAAQC